MTINKKETKQGRVRRSVILNFNLNNCFVFLHGNYGNEDIFVINIHTMLSGKLFFFIIQFENLIVLDKILSNIWYHILLIMHPLLLICTHESDPDVV